MMATLITWSKGALFSVFFGLTISLVSTGFAEVYPVRSPMAELGYEPWPGFRLPRHSAFVSLQNTFSPSLGAATDSGWVPWLRREQDSSEVQPQVVPRAKVRTSKEPNSPWFQALQAAGQLDVIGIDRALAQFAAESRAQKEDANKLRFALAVQKGNRAQAERWYHKVSWLDGGATGLRMAQWRALELGDLTRLQRAMGPEDKRDRSQALLGWVAWMQGQPFDEPIQLSGGKDPLQVWLAMLDARHAREAGEPRLAQAALKDVGEGPPGWRETINMLRRMPELSAGNPENSAYESLVTHFVHGEDGKALQALDAWLETRPGSSLRAHAYFLRAQIHLDAGEWDQASSDARAAGSLGNESLKQRAKLLRAILYGIASKFNQAEEVLQSVSSSTWVNQNEAEYLFYQQRLARMQNQNVTSLISKLEEGFSDTPWLGLARADVDPDGWGRPVRVVPDWSAQAPSTAMAVPEIPREGPWQALAFGPDYLSELASTLRQFPETHAVEATQRSTLTAAAGNPPVGGVLGFGGGARTTGFAEGGFSGRFGSLEVRARGEAIRTEEPKRLPLSQRASATVHVGQITSGARWSVEGSGFGREEGAHRIQRDSEVFDLPAINGESWGGSFSWLAPPESFGLNHFTLRHQNSHLTIPDRLRYQYRETDIGVSGTSRSAGGRWQGVGNLRWSEAKGLDGEKKVLSPETRLARQWDNGLYAGVVGALYDKDGLLMPVLGYDRKLENNLRVYVASEPQMKLSSFEDTFFQNGDWNVPALSRKPFRQSLDARLGFDWSPNPGFNLGMQANWFGGKHFGTWTFEDGLWAETFLDQVEGTVVGGHLAMGSGLRLEIRGERRWVDQNGQPVPFLLTQHGEAKLSLGNELYRLATRWVAIRGRTDHLGERFGDFLRGDVELTYRSRRYLEYSLRIENIANAADRRWPGYPAYGRGVFGGLRWLFGSGG